MKQNKETNKTERELFEEEIAKWPEELERRAEERRKHNQKHRKGPTPQFNSIQEFLEYYPGSMPWDDFFQKWINKTN